MRRAIAVCGLLGALAPRHGRAAPDAPIGGVVLGGDADARDRRVVGDAVRAAARDAGWLIPDADAATDEVDCGGGEPAACEPAALAGRGGGRVIAVAIEHRQADNGAPMVVLTGRLVVAAPPALVVGQRFCEHCADDRLTAAARELVGQLVRELAVRAGRTILDVTSTPRGARITVDGRAVGATDATFSTSPGAHRVVVERAGYRAAARTVIAVEGKTAVVAFALTPAGASRRVAVALVAGGLVAVAAGGALLELGARGGPQDRYVYVGATPAGAALGLAGAAAIAVGAYGWWRASRSQPTLVLTQRGGVVAGWRAAF
jgi:hypothetical protein